MQKNSEKPPVVIRKERADKIKRVKTRLAEIHDYKRLLAEEGRKPDEDDKRLESELIVQLLRLEKGLSAKVKPVTKKKKKTAKKKAKSGNPRTARKKG